MSDVVLLYNYRHVILQYVLRFAFGVYIFIYKYLLIKKQTNKLYHNAQKPTWFQCNFHTGDCVDKHDFQVSIKINQQNKKGSVIPPKRWWSS